jgi:hypothetical protein
LKKSEAVKTIYRIINSGIIDEDLEGELGDICIAIEDDAWDEEEEKNVN